MTTHPDAMRWNERYQTDGDNWLQRSPRRLLLDHAHLLPSTGLALDAAAGVALHGLFLAERGLHVIALDISEVGLRLAQKRARTRGLYLETAVVDLACPWLPPHTFDVIVNFRFLQRETFPVYRCALKPGGLLVFETFVHVDVDTPDPHYYLRPGELPAAFADFEILHQGVKDLRDENGRLVKRTSQLVARKPALHKS